MARASEAVGEFVGAFVFKASLRQGRNRTSVGADRGQGMTGRGEVVSTRRRSLRRNSKEDSG